MAETKPIQIFLCHASEDKAAVLDIYDRLKALGYKPWLDKKDLLPGQLWEEEIPKAIRASDFILIFLSKTSVAKRGYVQKEFKLALEVVDEMPESTIYAIPVRLDDCMAPNQFRKFHWCNLFEADGFEHLLRALEAGRLSLQQATATPQQTPLMPATAARPKDDPALTRQPFEPEMILIPAGEFLMGSDPQKDPIAADNEQPQHFLDLPDYYLAKTPVTNAQYRAFVQTTGHYEPESWRDGRPPSGEADHPVVWVSWSDALAYCRWLSEVTGRGYNLPSEAEWEKGARGTDGRIYPWGNRWDTMRCHSFESGLKKTTSVQAYPRGASPYGILDMVGNVWEWTRSLWGRDLSSVDFRYPYNATDGRENLYAPPTVLRVLRSNAYLDHPWDARCARRDGFAPNCVSDDLGFRVVMHP
jgi:formylglycine-generating enzyme required for sulfatase activity